MAFFSVTSWCVKTMLHKHEHTQYSDVPRLCFTNMNTQATAKKSNATILQLQKKQNNLHETKNVNMICTLWCLMYTKIGLPTQPSTSMNLPLHSNRQYLLPYTNLLIKNAKILQPSTFPWSSSSIFFCFHTTKVLFYAVISCY